MSKKVEVNNNGKIESKYLIDEGSVFCYVADTPTPIDRLGSTQLVRTANVTKPNK